MGLLLPSSVNEAVQLNLIVRQKFLNRTKVIVGTKLLAPVRIIPNSIENSTEASWGLSYCGNKSWPNWACEHSHPASKS